MTTTTGMPFFLASFHIDACVDCLFDAQVMSRSVLRVRAEPEDTLSDDNNHNSDSDIDTPLIEGRSMGKEKSADPKAKAKAKSLTKQGHQ